MPYVINNTSGTKIFYVGDQSFNTETALTLPGRNVPDYGEPVDTNFVHLLENFANSTPPQSTVTLTGQLWYDTSDGIFKVYDGTNWVQTGKVPVSELPPTGNQVEGNFYFDETIRKLKVYYENTWYDSSYAGEVSTSYNTIGQGSPNLFGARIRNIFLRRASDNRDVPVLAVTQSYDGLDTIDIVNGTVPTLYGSETLIGLFSRNPEFVALDVVTNSEEEALNFWNELNEPGGIGTTIRPGLNMRKDATAEYPIASLARRAETSYALNLGSYGADGANIAAANVYHHLADSLPASNLTYNLGAPANVFGRAYINDLYLSNALLATNDNVSIGTDDRPIQNMYVTNIEIDGNLLIEGDNVSIGSNTSPVGNIYVDELYVFEHLSIGNVEGDTNYFFPSSRAGNSRLVCNDDGTLYWLDNGAVFTNISPENGIQVNIRVDDYGGSYGNIFNRTASIGAVIGKGLSFDANGAIQVEFTEFTTCDIIEGTDCGNLWYSDERVFNFLDVAVAPPYDTGLQTVKNGTDDYTLQMHGGARRVVGSIQPETDSPIRITNGDSETRPSGNSNRDVYGFGLVEVGIQLGPVSASDGATGIQAGTGLDDSGAELSLDWAAVADNLFDFDASSDGPAGIITPAPVGTLGIARVTGNPSEPATHVLYVKSIEKLDGNPTDKIMYKHKNNVMETTLGKITFGTGTSQIIHGMEGNDNSRGYLRHNGNGYFTDGGGANNGSIICDGDVTAFRQSTSSDERLKKNISPITDGLDKVLKLQGVNYQFIKDRDNRREVGLIAQQVEEVVPEVVGEKEDGMKTVNYGALVGVLIEAIKELSQEVETLKAKLGD